MSASNIVAAGLAPQFLPVNGGSATLVAGTVSIAVPFLPATARVVLQRTAINGSPALGFLNATIPVPGVLGTQIVVTSYTALGAALATDVSSFTWSVLDA